MIIGLKGDNSKLKNLYKELGLKEVKPNSFEELKKAVLENEGSTVIPNYNEIMVFENPTADLVEKRVEVLNDVLRSKKNIFLAFTKDDPSMDKLPLDLAICTKVDTKDMAKIEEIFSFMNTDLPYNGKMKDDNYAVKVHDELRASERTLTELKKLLK